MIGGPGVDNMDTDRRDTAELPISRRRRARAAAGIPGPTPERRRDSYVNVEALEDPSTMTSCHCPTTARPVAYDHGGSGGATSFVIGAGAALIGEARSACSA